MVVAAVQTIITAAAATILMAVLTDLNVAEIAFMYIQTEFAAIGQAAAVMAVKMVFTWHPSAEILKSQPQAPAALV